MLTRDVSWREVVEVIHALPGKKSPGPDGMSGLFHKRLWHIIAVDVFSAIKHLFKKCKNAEEIEFYSYCSHSKD